MKYLLDVNVLLALAMDAHEFHAPVVNWLKHENRREHAEVATCAIGELGFVRILCQPMYGYSVLEAKRLLRNIKSIPELKFSFLSDNMSALELPDWVTKSGHVTDGHLVELAKAHGVVLATLDAGISGAFLIPT